MIAHETVIYTTIQTNFITIPGFGDTSEILANGFAVTGHFNRGSTTQLDNLTIIQTIADNIIIDTDRTKEIGTNSVSSSRF
jgi:hypothetical protein